MAAWLRLGCEDDECSDWDEREIFKIGTAILTKAVRRRHDSCNRRMVDNEESMQQEQRFGESYITGNRE
jgi:hypothetical protein